MRHSEIAGLESAQAHLTHRHGIDAASSSSEWVSIDRLSQGSERVGGMVVRSAQVRKILRTISRLGPYKATVLIHGESGTGKELVARALHTLGPTPDGPFVTFNCSNLVESLAESQLFGHVKGAFTDAREDSLGYFRSADGGTLFLDEIAELPLKLQPKLLRAVESGEVQPVGSAKNYHVDIRLVAATNHDLRAMVKNGQFRDDLYYRLNTAAIYLPPLRERRDAIPAFVGHFIEHYNRLFGKEIKYVSSRALDALVAHNWPGNVRELAHAIESAVILTDGDRITLDELPDHVKEDGAVEGAEPPAFEAPRAELEVIDGGVMAEKQWPYALDAVIREASKIALIRALEATHGNCHRAAELLGVSRYTVYRMLNRYGLAEGRAYRNLRKNGTGAS
ncbi:MAG TPA: sigma-54 dependent transcriptional regulator [Candidatus Binataceae bacterium]|nr:sigma-54 dependent transcriptional regulator [Candidatus Binataceae bacterium]